MVCHWQAKSASARGRADDELPSKFSCWRIEQSVQCNRVLPKRKFNLHPLAGTGKRRWCATGKRSLPVPAGERMMNCSQSFHIGESRNLCSAIEFCRSESSTFTHWPALASADGVPLASEVCQCPRASGRRIALQVSILANREICAVQSRSAEAKVQPSPTGRHWQAQMVCHWQAKSASARGRADDELLSKFPCWRIEKSVQCNRVLPKRKFNLHPLGGTGKRRWCATGKRSLPVPAGERTTNCSQSFHVGESRNLCSAIEFCRSESSTFTHWAALASADGVPLASEVCQCPRASGRRIALKVSILANRAICAVQSSLPKRKFNLHPLAGCACQCHTTLACQCPRASGRRIALKGFILANRNLRSAIEFCRSESSIFTHWPALADCACQCHTTLACQGHTTAGASLRHSSIVVSGCSPSRTAAPEPWPRFASSRRRR